MLWITVLRSEEMLDISTVPDNSKKDLGAYWKISQDIPLNPFVQDTLGGQMEREGGSSFKLKPPTCILAANQKEILSPHCCQFQFIRGKCHLLILITMHNSQEISLRTLSENASRVMSAIESRDSWIICHAAAPGSFSLPQKYNKASPTHKECEGNRPWRNLFERETH